jgi:hypothetical protein
VPTASRSSNRNGNARSSDARTSLRSVGRRLKSGAPAHDFTIEERRRGAQRTNEIKRERAAKRREAKPELLDLAEQLYLLKADKMLVLQALNRLSQELSCSDCRRALSAVELVLKYLVRPRLPKEPGLGAAAIAIGERIRDLGLDPEVEDIVGQMLRSDRETVGTRDLEARPLATHPGFAPG